MKLLAHSLTEVYVLRDTYDIKVLLLQGILAFDVVRDRDIEITENPHFNSGLRHIQPLCALILRFLLLLIKDLVLFNIVS